MKEKTNIFCRLKDLGNESSVEQFFVSRLLEDMGYKDSEIKPKESLDKLAISLGRRKVKYKPDYAIVINKKVRWIVDAKATTENLENWIGQCAGYCLLLNRGYIDEDPVEKFALTNGNKLQVYEWNQDECILELDFEDFQEGNPKFQLLYEMLGRKSVMDKTHVKPLVSKVPMHTLKRISIDEVNLQFAWCHQHIYKKDNISQSAAFMEFVKVIFLKLLSDREVRRSHPEFNIDEDIIAPADEVQFSIHWILEREKDHPSPLCIQFQLLKDRFEDMIQEGTKKRIFGADDIINLTPETIKGVVERLEKIDLFGIDADLNGRLFETFLSATMRGKDLGQYFTPRSIVKLMVSLSGLKVTRDSNDIVFDPCCGTGGFLIDSLATMWDKVDSNPSLSNTEKTNLKERIANESIYGVDVGKDPPVARITRINMYLHGDGGTCIYQADSLDKKLRVPVTTTPELKKELRELKRLLAPKGFCDVILTNPPFAKEYSRRHEPQNEILDKYDLAFDTEGGGRKPLSSLLSKIMFIERYHDFLKSGGRVLAIIDDSILGSKSHKRVREHIRKNYLIRAVVSLPGDSFQRAMGRVKTSIIYLQKRTSLDEIQPPVFMYYCTSIGIDDTARQRVLPIDAINRRKAEEEIEAVTKLFQDFLEGKRNAKKWTVAPDKLSDRFDVKYCLPKPGGQVKTWKKEGLTIVTLESLVDVMDDDSLSPDDIIITKDNDDEVVFIRVSYEGYVELGEITEASNTKYSRLYRVHTNDIVISNLGAVYGAIAVVPKEFDGGVVTKEYVIYRAKEGTNPHLVRMLLRSPEARADTLLLSSGMGRTRFRWDEVKNLKLPLPPDRIAAQVIKQIEKAERLERNVIKARKEAQILFNTNMKLDTDKAKTLIEAFKPPR